MKVCPSEHIQQQLFWYGYYEKEAVLTWETLIGKDHTVIDIGANAGYYTLIAAPRAKQVIAFEPSHEIRAQLEGNVRRNGFENVRIESFALSNVTRQADLFLSRADNTGMSSLQPPENFPGKKESVSVITLDEWIATQPISSLTLVKIDVEGAEWNVLSGMTGILAKYKPVLFVEVISELLARFGHSVNDVYDLLHNLGYAAYEIVAPNTLRRVMNPAEADTIVFISADFQWPTSISAAMGSDLRS